MSKAGHYRAIAEYYDAEYVSNYVLDHDVPMLLSHLPKRRQRILELCCGTGRCAVPLAEAGHRVTGIDIDPALLAIARRKKQTSALRDDQLELLRADVLKFRREGAFDWVCLIFNTFLNFTTLAEQDAILRNAHASLRSGGRFWIDIFYPDLGILGVEHHEHFDSNTFYVPALNRSVHRTTELRRSKKRPQLQEVTFHYTWADDQGEVHHEQIRFDMTWMYPRELVLLLERHGFAVERLYGDYDGSDVTPESPRLICLAKKR